MRLGRCSASLLLVLLVGGCVSQRAIRPEAGPNAWFMNQRRSAGPIPPRAVAAALEQAASEGVAVTAGPGSWVNQGPLNIGGRLTSLAVDPNDVNHIWVGAAAGGVFDSRDAGMTWTARFDAQNTLTIGAIATHPTNSNIVYVGTGEDNGGGFSYDGDGVYKTTDGGLTWQNMGLAATRRIGKIAVDPTNGDRLFVAAGGNWFDRDENRGIYRSTDGGTSWQKVLFVADDVGAIDVAIDPSNPQRVFAAMWQRLSSATSWYLGGSGGGIYLSTDGGTTWSEQTTGLPASPGRIGIAISPSTPQTVYALVINNDGAFLEGVYRSTNGGTVWTKRSQSSQSFLFSSYSYYFGKIRVDPTNANTVYCLDASLLRSTNGGTSFTSIANSVHSDFHELRILAGGRWYVADDGGFFKSTDSGTTWTHAVTLPISQLYDIGIDNQNTRRRFAGLQDNFVNRTTTGGQSDWQSVIGGDGLQVEVDPTNGSKVYGESQYGAIQRSTDGGDTWSIATNGINGADRVNWNAPISLDPIVPSTLYTGTYRVYRSTDSAQNWTPISPNLSNSAPSSLSDEHRLPADWKESSWGTDHLESLISGTVTVVQVSPVNRNVIWAGTDDGNVWVTTNAGSSWSKVNPPGPAYWVTDIGCDPRDERAAYLTVTGYRSHDKLAYLRVTRDLGQTWTDLSSTLPQLPLNTVLVDTDWRGRLFVGSDISVHWSDNDGQSWQLLSGNLPRIVIFDLWKHESSNTLWAGSFARGLYTYDLGQLPSVADGDGDGVDNNVDCALADASAFAVPAEVAALLIGKDGSGAALLSWTSLASQAGTGTTYDAARGRLSTVAQQGLSDASALTCGLAGTSTSDSGAVIAGDGFYYLVRGRNACGRGGWGRSSAFVERNVTACP